MRAKFLACVMMCSLKPEETRTADLTHPVIDTGEKHLLRRISRHSLSKSPKVPESIVQNPMFTRQWTRETFFNSVQNGGTDSGYALGQLAPVCFE